MITPAPRILQGSRRACPRASPKKPASRARYQQSGSRSVGNSMAPERCANYGGHRHRDATRTHRALPLPTYPVSARVQHALATLHSCVPPRHPCFLSFTHIHNFAHIYIKLLLFLLIYLQNVWPHSHIEIYSKDGEIHLG